MPTLEFTAKVITSLANNNAETSTQTSPINAVSPKNQKVTPLILNSKEFDTIYNLLIEKIANYESSAVSGTTIENSIESVISKINSETVSVDEILENDLGQKIYTLLVLLDELSDSVPEPTMSIEFEVRIVL